MNNKAGSRPAPTVAPTRGSPRAVAEAADAADVADVAETRGGEEQPTAGFNTTNKKTQHTHDIALRNTKGGLAIQVPRRRVTATSRNSSRTGHVDSREPDLSHQSGARPNSIISEWMGVKAHWNHAMTGPLDVSFRSVFATRYSSIDAVGGMMYASARTRTTRTTAPMMSRFLS